MRILLALLALSLFPLLSLGAPEKRAGYLGAQLADATEPAGVRLTRVLPETPAAKAGLKDGDVVVSVDGDDIESATALAKKLREAGAGTKVQVAVVRGEERTTLAVTLGVHPRVLLEEPDTSPGMKKVKVTRDHSYFVGEGKAHERHKLDLFLPETDEPFPIVLWIHAGAWSYGDRSRETALAMRFAERGIGFAPMSYRLSSRFWNEPSAPKEGVKHPAHAHDCAMAFAWLKKKFAGHPLFLSGHSCGAHLAALLGTDPSYLQKHDLELKEIRGVIAIGGGYDLVKYHAILANGVGGQQGLGKEKADAHLQWIFGPTKEDWIAASPTTYLKGCTTPMFVVSEKGDAMKQYTEDFRTAAEALGVTSIRFRHAADRTHGQSTPFMSRKASDPIRDEMIAFIQKRSR